MSSDSDRIIQDVLGEVALTILERTYGALSEWAQDRDVAHVADTLQTISAKERDLLLDSYHASHPWHGSLKQMAYFAEIGRQVVPTVVSEFIKSVPDPPSLSIYSLARSVLVDTREYLKFVERREQAKDMTEENVEFLKTTVKSAASQCAPQLAFDEATSILFVSGHLFPVYPERIELINDLNRLTKTGAKDEFPSSLAEDSQRH